MTDGLEEGAYRAASPTGQQQVELASIAISLKRIADALEGVPYDHAPGADNAGHRVGLVDGIMMAIEQGMLAGRNG